MVQRSDLLENQYLINSLGVISEILVADIYSDSNSETDPRTYVLP
jgi:hypothetical protein